MSGEFDYGHFKKSVLELTGIDLNLYKEKQMKRRIETLIGKLGLSGYEEYAELLGKKPEMLAYFQDYITINVTEFFRTEEHWDFLLSAMLPSLAEAFDHHLEIWSTACSTGEEPYSLAIALMEYDPELDFHILATDINEKVLKTAEKGLYATLAMKNVPSPYLDQYFEKKGNSYQIAESVRSHVEFRQFNLLKDEYPKHLSLIVCRNVLIYFTEEAKNGIFWKFRDSLDAKGCLFLGHTEQIIHYKTMGLIKNTPCFYSKPS